LSVHVVGAAYTPLGRHIETSVEDLTAEAVRGALADADADVEAIEYAVFANTRQGAMEGQHGIRGECALRPLGLGGIPIVNTDNACASSGFAAGLAFAALEAGVADVALAVGTEKMWYPEELDRMYAAFLGSWDVRQIDATTERLLSLAERTPLPEGVADERPDSIFMAVYAALARQYMALYGTTVEEFAAVAAKNFGHGALNPRAQRRRERTTEEVLADKLVAWPLTRSMCAPISDGAGALVLVSDRVLDRFERARAVRVRTVSLGSGRDRDIDDYDHGGVRIAADRAYAKAGIVPEDVDVAEVHDATAVGEVIQLENLRLFARGEAGAAAVRGETALGGELPVNTSGGLTSKGHPTAATGAIQICDLVEQLRGEAGERQVPGARIGLAECGGGFYGVEDAAMAITVLEAPSERGTRETAGGRG
jgi:acetyl-CoA acetyltransferase